MFKENELRTIENVFFIFFGTKLNGFTISKKDVEWSEAKFEASNAMPPPSRDPSSACQ